MTSEYHLCEIRLASAYLADARFKAKTLERERDTAIRAAMAAGVNRDDIVRAAGLQNRSRLYQIERDTR